jgi:hypothetical protein
VITIARTLASSASDLRAQRRGRAPSAFFAEAD